MVLLLMVLLLSTAVLLGALSACLVYAENMIDVILSLGHCTLVHHRLSHPCRTNKQTKHKIHISPILLAVVSWIVGWGCLGFSHLRKRCRAL
ncbi:hypothetical protein F5Y12DRAFT_146552 [Xylaria sp. FL1777]|nr:hypothetical protein F5Y12DRAFT_146552 [Xylaria sp. FL1777]